jgi:hypothetical protein
MDNPWTAPVKLGLLVATLCLAATSVGSYFQYQQVKIARQSVVVGQKADDGRSMNEIAFYSSVGFGVLALFGFGMMVYVSARKPSTRSSPPASESANTKQPALEIIRAFTGFSQLMRLT